VCVCEQTALGKHAPLCGNTSETAAGERGGEQTRIISILSLHVVNHGSVPTHNISLTITRQTDVFFPSDNNPQVHYTRR
jgi:hypothetical protein